MSEQNIMQRLLKNSAKSKQQSDPDQHIEANPLDSTPIHYEEAQVQSDLPMIDSELEAIKKPYGL